MLIKEVLFQRVLVPVLVLFVICFGAISTLWTKVQLSSFENDIELGSLWVNQLEKSSKSSSGNPLDEIISILNSALSEAVVVSVTIDGIQQYSNIEIAEVHEPISIRSKGSHVDLLLSRKTDIYQTYIFSLLFSALASLFASAFVFFYIARIIQKKIWKPISEILLYLQNQLDHLSSNSGATLIDLVTHNNVPNEIKALRSQTVSIVEGFKFAEERNGQYLVRLTEHSIYHGKLIHRLNEELFKRKMSLVALCDELAIEINRAYVSVLSSTSSSSNEIESTFPLQKSLDRIDEVSTSLRNHEYSSSDLQTFVSPYPIVDAVHILEALGVELGLSIKSLVDTTKSHVKLDPVLILIASKAALVLSNNRVLAEVSGFDSNFNSSKFELALIFEIEQDSNEAGQQPIELLNKRNFDEFYLRHLNRAKIEIADGSSKSRIIVECEFHSQPFEFSSIGSFDATTTDTLLFVSDSEKGYAIKDTMKSDDKIDFRVVNHAEFVSDNFSKTGFDKIIIDTVSLSKSKENLFLAHEVIDHFKKMGLPVIGIVDSYELDRSTLLDDLLILFTEVIPSTDSPATVLEKVI